MARIIRFMCAAVLTLAMPAGAWANGYTVCFYTEPTRLSARTATTSLPSTSLQAMLEGSVGSQAAASATCTPTAQAHFLPLHDILGNDLYLVYDAPRQGYPLATSSAANLVSSNASFAFAANACAEADGVQDDTLHAYRQYQSEAHSFNSVGVCSVCGFKRNAGLVSHAKNCSVNSIRLRLHANGTATFMGLKNKKTARFKVPGKVTVKGYPYRVTRVAAKACKKMPLLSRVKFGGQLKRIGKRAFAGCRKLKTVRIASSKLSYIGPGAFRNCTRLASFTCKSTKIPRKMLKNAGLL